MPIHADFSALWREVNRIAETPASFDLAQTTTFDPIDIELEKGLEIDINSVDFSGPVASYQGRQILLYIPDQGHYIDDVLTGRHEGKKFHVTDCRTLDSMRKQNRFERYFATNDLSGEFKVFGHTTWGSKQVEGVARLRVCKNCMMRLNYKGFRTEVRAKDAFVRDFNIAEFFETYSSFFSTLPRALRATDNTGYTNDWPTIASKLKSARNFTCEECRVDLTDAKRLLHVHHINGVKSDNDRGNLRVLCAGCHRQQPHHSHLHVSHADMQTINRFRRQQSVTLNEWDEALKLADPAVYGALSMLRKDGYPTPEIGYEIQDQGQAVIAEFEAAWPSMKFALVLTDAQKNEVAGWTIKTISELHRERA